METVKFIKGKDLLASGFERGIVLERMVISDGKYFYSIFAVGDYSYPTGKLFVDISGDIVPNNDYAVIEIYQSIKK